MFEGIAYLFKTCAKYNKKYLIILAIKQFFTIFTGLVALIIPKYILDALFTNINYAYAVQMCVVFLLVLLVSGILSNYLGNRAMIEKMLVFKKFQLYLDEKMMNAPLEKIESATFLDLKSKSDQFLYGGGSGFATVLEGSFDMIGKCITLLALMGIISQLNVYLMLVLMLTILLGTIVNFFSQKKSIKINLEKSVQERRTAYYSHISKEYKYGKEIRINNCSPWILRKYEQQLDAMQGFYRQIAKNNLFFGILTLLLGVVQQGVSYLYLIFTASTGLLSVGQFTLYLSSIASFSSNLKEIISGVVSMNQYTDYYHAFKEYSNVDLVKSEQKAKIELSNHFKIEFIDVSFKYEGQQDYALKNINAHINAKDVVSIVGKNGAGKSTFIKLLLRLYQPTSGKILLNGVDIGSIDYDTYIKHFSCVFQDFQLFSFSLKENIALVDEREIQIEKLNQAIIDIELDEKIKKKPNGLDTKIHKDFDPEGYYPSGGEAQRIAIARAIYKKSSITILDEPTASLDPQSEYNINDNLRKVFKDNTIIYISHRMSSTRFSSKILVFDGGEITEVGTHDVLMQNKGLYHQLFSQQAYYYDENCNQ